MRGLWRVCFLSGRTNRLLHHKALGRPQAQMVRPLLLPLIPPRVRLSLSFSSPAPSSTPPAPDTPESRPHPPASGPLAPSIEAISTKPPPKRRRAKRSEEERIQYLRSDPYVAEFEAFRVHCASCDKWIRLRPNSTYCSIPWDAHRKSCLARKGCVISIPPHTALCHHPYSTPPAVPRSRLAQRQRCSATVCYSRP